MGRKSKAARILHANRLNYLKRRALAEPENCQQEEVQPHIVAVLEQVPDPSQIQPAHVIHNYGERVQPPAISKSVVNAKKTSSGKGVSSHGQTKLTNFFVPASRPEQVHNMPENKNESSSSSMESETESSDSQSDDEDNSDFEDKIGTKIAKGGESVQHTPRTFGMLTALQTLEHYMKHTAGVKRSTANEKAKTLIMYFSFATAHHRNPPGIKMGLCKASERTAMFRFNGLNPVYRGRSIRKLGREYLKTGKLTVTKKPSFLPLIKDQDFQAKLRDHLQQLTTQSGEDIGPGIITTKMFCEATHRAAIELGKDDYKISAVTARRWLKILGYSCTKEKKGFCLNGHEMEPDVV